MLLSYIFISIFFICKAVSDTLAHHYSTSVFKTMNPLFWNASISWINKWKTLDGKMILLNNKSVEKFFGSSTIFVFLTDRWHLFNHIGIYAIVAAIVARQFDTFMFSDNIILSLVIESLIYLSALIWFNIFYKYLKK